MSDSLGAQESAMSMIGSRTLHRNTKEVLDHVERGESVVILRYGRPAAALVPIDEEQAKALVLASSPQLRESRATRAAGEHAAPEPFAVAEREISGDEDGGRAEREPAEATVAQAELVALTEEADRLLRIAKEGLTLQTGLFGKSSAGGTTAREIVSVDTSLLAIQQRSVHAALAELLHGFREQAETLDALARRGQASG